jgi:hypothetical protein
MKILGASWRTTLMGLLTIIATLGHVADAILAGKPIEWTIVMAGLTSGAGLMRARDDKVSSEQAGAGIIPPKP